MLQPLFFSGRMRTLPHRAAGERISFAAIFHASRAYRDERQPRYKLVPASHQDRQGALGPRSTGQRGAGGVSADAQGEGAAMGTNGGVDSSAVSMLRVRQVRSSAPVLRREIYGRGARDRVGGNRSAGGARGDSVGDSPPRR